MMLSTHANKLVLKDPIFHTNKYPKPSIPPKPFKARVLIHHKTLFNHGNPKTLMKFHSGYPYYQDSGLHYTSNRVSSQPNNTPSPVYRKDDKKCEGELIFGVGLSGSDEEIEKEFGLRRGMDARLLTCKLRDQGSWERVLRVFGWMKRQKDYLPNVVHYQVVLRSLGLARRWDELRLCWIEMGKDGVVPTNYVYSMLVDVCGRAGFVREALWWVKEMRSRAKFPNEVVMGTVVGVLKKAGEFDAADRFYKDWCVGMADLEGIDLEGLGEARSRAQNDAVRLKSFLSAEVLKMGASNGSLNVAVNSNRKGYVRRVQLSNTYDALIDLYGKADRLSDAVNVFSELLASGLAVDVSSFNTMIHTFGSHGHLPEAVSLFFKMIGRGIYPDIRTYEILILLYGEAGNVDAALRFFRDIREVGLFPSVGTYRAVLHVLCRRQMVQEAEDVIRDMRESSIPVDKHFLPVVMAMYASDELHGQAAKVLRMSHLNCRLSSKLYARIINIYAEKGLWAEAEAVFFRKQDSGEEKKDVMEYNVMIKAYGVAKLYDKAFSLFKEMRKAGTWPDQCTYNSLIQMFSGADLVDRGKELLAQMQGLGFIPNSSTFAGVIASYVRLGWLSDAVDVFRDMERAAVEPNEAAYGSLINGFAAAGRFDDALYYYRLMEDKGLSANKIVLTSLIKAYRYSNRNDLQGAKRIYEKLVELEGEPDKPASSCMLNLYARLGMIEDAEVMYNTMKEKEWLDKFTYPVMITLYKNMGKLDEAVSVADDMKGSLYHPSERVKDSADILDQFALNGAIDIYAKLGKVSDAEFIFDTLKDHNLANAFTYSSMMRMYKRAGKLDEAVAVALQVKQSLCSTSQSSVELGNELNILDYNGMIDIFANFLMATDAKVIFDKMKEKAMADGFSYVTMLRLYRHAGMLDAAAEVAEDVRCFFGITSEGFNESEYILDRYILNLMISLYVDLRMVSDAEVIFEAMKGKDWADGLTYTSMMLLYRHLGMLEKAVSIAEEMKQSLSSGSMILKNREGEIDILALKSMIRVYTDLGMASDARAMFDIIKGTGRADAWLYVNILRMFKRAGMLDVAAKTAEEIKQLFFKASDGLEELERGIYMFALNCVVKLYADLSMVSDASMIFDAMKVKGWVDGYTYASMIHLYRRAGMLDEACSIVEEMRRSFHGSSKNLKVSDSGHCVLNKVALGGMISIYADLGMIADAKLVFHIMKEKGWADKFTYASMMRLYSSMAMFSEAVAIADEMRQSGSLTDIYSFAKVMALCAARGMLRECGLLLQEMVTERITPDNFMLKILLIVLKKKALAIEAVEQLAAVFHQEKAYAQQAIITCVFSVMGMHDLAVKSCIGLKGMNLGFDSCPYNVAIYAFSAAGKTDQALKFYEVMLANGIKPDVFTYISLLRCYCEANMVEEVSEIHDRLKYGKIEPTESLFTAVIHAYKTARRYTLAKLAKEDMEAVLDEHSHDDFEFQGDSEEELECISNEWEPCSDSESEGEDDLITEDEIYR